MSIVERDCALVIVPRGAVGFRLAAMHPLVYQRDSLPGATPHPISCGVATVNMGLTAA